jgi:hypothetical protein
MIEWLFRKKNSNLTVFGVSVCTGLLSPGIGEGEVSGATWLVVAVIILVCAFAEAVHDTKKAVDTRKKL